MKKILIPFLNAIDPTSGGVERVYHNLVPSLNRMGYEVYATYHVKSQYDKCSVYTECFYLGEKSRNFEEVKKDWLHIINQKNIGIVICPFVNSLHYDFFSRQKHLQVFFHIHNVPSIYCYPSYSKLPKCFKDTLVDSFLKWLRFTIFFKKSFNRINKSGMKVILLSERFRKDLKSFCTIDDVNIKAIPNPLVIDRDFDLKNVRKTKTILYVGRITTQQKRFQSLLNIWEKLQNLLPEYNLDVVGGGPEKDFYESKAKEMHLKRVTFHGFQSPEDFYKNAQALCMVSNYEGFGMVLVEAMQYGCVPFAFDSFTALSDIIDDGVDGFKVKPFDETLYAQKVAAFANMTSDAKEKIYNACRAKVNLFSVDHIAEIWSNLFKNYSDR